MPTEPTRTVSTELDAIVFGEAEPWLVERTLRSLASRGVGVTKPVATAKDHELAERVAEAKRPVWLVRAGAWSLAAPSSVLLGGRGRPVVALGATAESALWQEMLALTGGDLGHGAARARTVGAWPRVDSAVALDPASFAPLVAEGGTVEEAAALAAASARARVVRVPSLDVGFQRRRRVVLAVTTLHRGGAERIVLDLASGLRAAGHDVLLAVLDRPARATFEDAPSVGTIHLHEHATGRRARLDLLARIAVDWGADALHVHLLDGHEVERLCRSEVPVVVTVHNARPGWPARLREALVAERSPALVVGCSRDVSRELLDVGGAAPVRTIWNGIASQRARARANGAERASTRARLGVEGSGPLLVAIANHRPQKRLELLPAVLAAVRARGLDAKLAIVGEPVRADAASLAIADLVRVEADRHGVADHVVLAASVSADEMPAVYAAADVVVSASAFEGLSLVHLEALDAGLPLVTTRVSGVDELARKHPHVYVVDGADPSALAEAAATALTAGRSSAERVGPDFSTRAMSARHVELFARVSTSSIASRPSRGGLVVVTNNFSTGGAQSSAGRLLRGLRARGVSAEAIVIEEQAAFPTPGRVALEAAGVPVTVAPRAGLVDPLVTARAVVERVDALRPRAVLFWNAIPEHKLLIADLLLGANVWDVSPGEMYFASLERYLRRPRPGLPYVDARDYGRLLRGVIVKYAAERERAEAALGAPVFVVPNGVVVPRGAIRRPRAPGDAIVAGTLARIAPDKKLEQLVDAVAHAHRRGAWPSELSVDIAGAPERGYEDYAAALRARAEGLPIRWVGEQESAAFLGAIDLFAMVSEPSGCPNASLEAMAAGLPVVATDAGGASEQIVDGETGGLVPRGDVAALGDAIVLLAQDPARRARLGDAAHARARSLFDVERMVTDYIHLCLET